MFFLLKHKLVIGIMGDGCGRTMLLGSCQYWGVLLILIILVQGSTVLVVTVPGICLDSFSLDYLCLSLSLEDGSIRTEILSQGAVSSNQQSTNQP